jgi:Zn2+/Cd2+-exporting ATPase
MKRSTGWTLLLSGVLIAFSWMLQWLDLWLLAADMLMAGSAVIGGVPIARRAISALRYRTFGIDLLITVAVTGSLGIGEYWEGAAVTFLFTLGAFLEGKTLEKTRDSIRSLLALSPMEATVIRDGSEVRVHPDEVQLGESVLVRPGEKIPVDGTVLQGRASVDQASITGESIPVQKGTEDSVFSGTIVQFGYLEVKAERVGEDTTFSRIVQFVEDAQESKAPTQRFIEKFAKYYTPGILILAAVLFLVTRDIPLTLTLLVISCPGALVIAAPVTIVSGIGNAARKGVLVKGGNTLEQISQIDVVAFDKTGTLTEGKPQVVSMKTAKGTEEAMLMLAARAERRSEHHLARAIITEAEKKKLPLTTDADGDFHSLPGKGIEAWVDGSIVLVGNRLLMQEQQLSIPVSLQGYIEAEESLGRTLMYVASEHEVLGCIAVADPLRAEAKQLVAQLKGAGIQHVIMLTGDHEPTARAAAEQLGITEYRSNLLPEHKVEMVRSLQAEGHRVMMVGDGVNDAPALAAANAGIAVGGTGTDIAMETADIILSSGKLERIGYLFGLSQAVMRVMKQNIVFAVAVAGLLVAGVLAETVFMASGMLIHELSVLLVIVNAIRVVRFGRACNGSAGCQYTGKRSVSRAVQ